MDCEVVEAKRTINSAVTTIETQVKVLVKSNLGWTGIDESTNFEIEVTAID